METFLQQIDKIMEEFGLKHDRDFDRAIGLQNKLYRWREGLDKGVNLETLILIRNRFKKTLDWMLFGGEETKLQESVESYSVRPLAPVEADLMMAVNKNIEEILRQERKKISPEERMKLLTRVYNDCAEDHCGPEAIMISRYLWMIPEKQSQ